MASKALTLKVGLIATVVDLEVGGPARDAADGLKTLCVGGGTHEPTPIKLPKTCAHCGTLDPDQVKALKKGRQVGRDGFQVVDVEERDALKATAVGDTAQQIAMIPHPREQVDAGTITGEKLYFLKPNSTASGVNYAIIRSLIAAHPELAFTGQYTPSTRVGTFVLEVQGDVIAMRERTLLVNARPRPAFEAFEPDANLDLAELMLDRLVADFDAASYVDQYAANLARLLDEQEVVAVSVAAGGGSASKAPTGGDLTAQLLEFTGAKKPAAKRAAAKRATPARRTARKAS